METAASPQPPPSPVVTVRPFSVGDVIGRAFSVWFGNFVPFSIVTLVVNVPVFLIVALAPTDTGRAWNLVVNLVSAFADLVVVGALTFGVLQSLRGAPAPLGALVATGFRKMGRVFVVSLGVGLRVFLWSLLLVVPGIMAFCRLYVAIPAAVVETESAEDPAERSAGLTDGSRWGIFVVALLVFVVTVAISATAGVIAVLGASALPQPIPLLVASILGALSSALGACASAVAYHDLRVAKEGVDTTALVKVFE